MVEGDAGLKLFTLQGLDAEQNRLRGDDRITFLNAAAERRYRVRAGDVLGCALTSIYTQLWPNPGAEAAMRAAASEHGVWRGELIHRTLDGRELHVETSVSTLR